MGGRGQWVRWVRAAMVAAPFLALGALPVLARIAPRPLAAGATVAVEPAGSRPVPPLTLARRWPREHAITQELPLTLYWGCRDGPGGCHFTEGKLVAESLGSAPLNFRADALGLDTFHISASKCHAMYIVAADGADCHTLVGEPHEVRCTLTNPLAILTIATEL